MKLTISTAVLHRRLAPCAEVPNARSPYAFGACVLLTAVGQQLSIRAFNMPLSIRATIGGDALKVSEPGSVAVPAEELLLRIAALKDDMVTLSTDGSKMTIKGSSSSRKYTLSCDAAEGFPAFPARPVDGVDVPADALKSVLSRTFYAVHDDASQPMFCGVALVAANDTLTASASNGHRIARAVAPSVPGALDTFVPNAAASTLLKVLDKGDVHVASSDRLVSFAVDGIELVYSRPESESPAYDLVLGSLRGTEGPSVDRRAMIAALKGITLDGTSGTVPIEVQSTGTKVVIRSQSSTGDESIDEVESVSSEKWTVYVEAKYLLEALRSWAGDEVTMISVASELIQDPLVLRCAGPAGGLATIGRCAPLKMKEAA